jgi:hypothetical protein
MTDRYQLDLLQHIIHAVLTLNVCVPCKATAISL